MNRLTNILALDVGDKRIGVALANTIARLPSPLAIVDNDAKVMENLKDIVQKNQIEQIVIGLPRNMKGEETEQSKITRDFAFKLSQAVDAEIIFADESLSTKRAEEYRRADRQHLDDIAACFILEEYLRGI